MAAGGGRAAFLLIAIAAVSEGPEPVVLERGGEWAPISNG